MAEEPKKVPLVIYIDHERRVIGEATVTGDEVRCRITEEGTEFATQVTEVIGAEGDFSFSMSEVPWDEQYIPIFRVQ